MQPHYQDNHCLVFQAANNYDVQPAVSDAITLQTLRDWFIGRLAAYTGITPDEIDSRDTCAAYGIDSISGVSLVGDLEMWLNVQLSPTLLWRHDSIEDICQYIMATLSHTADVPCSISPLYEEADTELDLRETTQFVSQLDSLTDADVDAMLHRFLAA